jgi:small subunit ribosomal protein S7
MKKNKNIKDKLINHLMKHGKKNTAEKLLLESMKTILKNSNKRADEVTQLALLSATPIFKLHQIKDKKRKKKNRKIKEIPAFISSQEKRMSAAAKLIVLGARKKKNKNFGAKLAEEICLNAEQKGFATEIKNDTQKKVLKNKNYFFYYRW